MKQQHGKYDVKNYKKGVISDISKELVDDMQEGSHADSLNMRSLAQDGNNLGKSHIGGESTFYPGIDTRSPINQSNPSTINFSKYICAMTQSINGHIVEIWCSQDNSTTSPNLAEPSFIRIDGDICLMSTDFPIYSNKPLQYDKNQHVLGSEFYITDFYSEPIIFNLQDLIDSYATTKYFSSFDISQYSIAIESNLYKPQFIDLVSSAPTGASVLGSTGIPIGQYSYSYRYVSASGDYSSFSPLTDLIPVILAKQKYTPLFNQGSVSSQPNISVFASLSPYIKLRYVNNGGFASIEIIRHSWQTGATLDTQPISHIIHTEDISGNLGMNVFAFIDRQYTSTAMTPISYLESNTDVTSITAAKSIRFYNKRLYLMNLKYKSKDIGDELNLDINKNYVFPTVQKMYKEGHSNVYNTTMYKSYMRGERQGFGVLLYDSNGSPSYVEPLPTTLSNNSYHHPNRRNKASLETIGTSYEGLVTATTEELKNGAENYTHEVFDHENATTRFGDLAYDIVGSAAGAVVRPTGQTDTNSANWEIGRPNIAVNSAPNEINYNPKCFGLDYYSLGVAVKDIKIPAGFTGFSIVKTQTAKRVLAQGIAMYNFDDPASCYVYFADLDKIDTTTTTQILANTAPYQLQVVSPLGFFTEIYSKGRDEQLGKGMDMITYSRILKEDTTINPTYNTGYVKYNSWIDTSDATLTAPYFNIQVAEEIQVESTLLNYLKLRLDVNIFNSDAAKHGTTPMYVVNLIIDTNDVSDESITEYTSTGHYQKLKSLIGEVKNQSSQSFPLISERWEDCISRPFNTANNFFNDYDALEKYIYVEDNLKVSTAWINVTYKSTIQITNILNAIVTNGFYQNGTDPKVYGVYKDNSIVFTESLQRNYEIIFEHFDLSYSIDFFIPKSNSSVYVHHDYRIPSRVFGGDTYVNECIWAFKDNKFNSEGFPVNPSTQFSLFSKFFPYAWYKMADQMYMYSDTSDSSPSFVGERTTLLGQVRQFINMFTAETRAPLCFAFEEQPSSLNNLSKFYPIKNYVPRPFVWDNGDKPKNIQPAYFTAYGTEQDYWEYGGFKYIQTINQDYANRNNAKLLTSVPKLGFEEQTNYPTRIVWSEKKAVNQQNSPSTKTFLPANKFDLSDNNGEIKFAWSATSEQKGSNLYAITGNGIALILVDKRVINDANAQELFSGSAVDEGVVDGLWLTQTIGMTDEYWRGWAEYNNALFFFNPTGVYALTSNQVEFLSEQGGFQEIYKNRVVPYIGKSYETKMAGAFNILTKEYVMTFDENNFPERGYNDLLPNSLIYGVTQQALQCRASYNHDKYLAVGNTLYGMRDGITFKLGQGNVVDGKIMVASVTGISTGKKGRFEPDVLYHSKEFIRIRVNSNHKPNRILFFDDYENYINGVVSSVVDSDAISYSIKDYGGYECYIPRKTLPPNLRQQGRLVLFRIENDINDDFTVNATMVQFKVLK